MQEFNIGSFDLDVLEGVDDLLGFNADNDAQALWHQHQHPHLNFDPSQTSPPRAPTLPTYPRPRNPRSCDFCRARKTACRIDHGPPCAACDSLGRDCTFAERPRKRRRRGDLSNDTTGPKYQRTSPKDARKSISSRSPNSSGDDHAFDYRPTSARLPYTIANGDETLIGRGGNGVQQDPSSIFGTSGCHAQDRDKEESLDARPGQTAFLLGDTGESDPHLLKHSTLAAQDQNPASKISYRRIHTDQESDEDNPLVFMFENIDLHEKYEPRVDKEVAQKAHAELDTICSTDVGIRLVKLHFKYVYPYFPILSRTQMLSPESELSENIQKLPLSLKAVLYATGIPFMVYDDVLSTTLDLTPPSAHKLYRICWLAVTQEIHSPRLSTLQACLLMLQRTTEDKYVMDSPFRWSLLAWTVSLAQSLGLSTDCSNWGGIPAWEKRLRRRLWWATYAMDKWSLMSAGLSSHISCDHFDVLPLTSKDFVSSHSGSSQGGEELQDSMGHERSHFYHLVELSMILSDVIDSYFTIRARKNTGTNFALTLELAKPLRSRLQSWKESYNAFVKAKENDPKQQTRLDGNASLGLAYPVATMILFRALLRSLEATGGTAEDKAIRESGREAVRAGAKACCVEVVQYVESVNRGVWDAFWHSWSRAGFAIASSFLIRLLVTSTSETETADLNGLIKRWRWAMRTGGGSSGNVLMSLGLLRLDRSLLKSGIRESGEES